jgi:DNA polymerase-1
MTKHSQKPIILIDGSSYFHRAFHALPSLTTSKGEPTGAMYGVINMIRKLVNDYDPEYIAVVFDTKGKTFRHEIYPKYKATRPPMPEELVAQVKPLHEIITAMGLPLIVIEGVEADDIIGTLAKKASATHTPILISTGDKDMAQLVDEHVTLINTMTDTILDTEGVTKKFGVPPNRMIDYLTLVGDTSDNIPGVPNIGPKTAVKLLQEYGSLDNIIKHAAEIKGKVGENLRNSLEQIPLSRELVTIKHDIKLGLNLSDLKKKNPDNEKLLKLCLHYEFKSWVASLAEKNPQKKSAETTGNYKAIFDETEFQEWVEKLHKSEAFAFDLETTSLDIIDAEIVGISFAVEIGEAIYIPVGHSYENAPKQLNRASVLKTLKPIFENPKKIKLGQNLKYDMSVLANYEIDLQGIGYDTMLESYVLNSTDNHHDKETLVLKYLGKQITTYEDVAGKGAKQLTFDKVDIQSATPYAAADSDLVLQLHKVMWPELEKHRKLIKVFSEIEIPLLQVLSRMERNGVHIDKNLLHHQSAHLAKRMAKIEEETHKIAGKTFNLNSPLQLQEILFTKLKLPIIQKTPTGQPSTAESVLQELSENYELPSLILEYRSLSKLKSTYTDSLPEQINPKTNRIHTSYNQAVTSTGRLSSTNPNLQNIPARTEEGRKIRQAFIASSPDNKIISADYSQIELRVMAHLSHDENLHKAFAAHSDIHTATAAEIFQIPPSEVTMEKRQQAKMINFGLIYGMSPFGLAKRLKLERKFADEFVKNYFNRYPKVLHYIENARLQASKNGFVETLFGRRLYTPDINSKNFARRAAAERAAINAPIQGTGADIMKIAMINIDEWLTSSKIDCKMIMQVHDELVFEVAKHEKDHALSYIKKYMENAVKLDVPLIVHIGVGDNWEEAH